LFEEQMDIPVAVISLVGEPSQIKPDAEMLMLLAWNHGHRGKIEIHGRLCLHGKLAEIDAFW
jgi:hypothetical protein